MIKERILQFNKKQTAPHGTVCYKQITKCKKVTNVNYISWVCWAKVGLADRISRRMSSGRLVMGSA